MNPKNFNRSSALNDEQLERWSRYIIIPVRRTWETNLEKFLPKPRWNFRWGGVGLVKGTEIGYTWPAEWKPKTDRRWLLLTLLGTLVLWWLMS